MKRRESIKLINAGLISVGMPSLFTNWSFAKEIQEVDIIQEFAKRNGIKYVSDSSERKSFEKDFGNILQAAPLAILIPNSIEQLQLIIRFAKEKKFHIVARGAGHSVGGQSLPSQKGITLDLRVLNQIEGIRKDQEDNDILVCRTGASLQQINEFLLRENRILPALPFYPGLTIGGVLNAGGVGSASHLNGLLISNVTELEVLSADGELVTCSRSKQSEIFYSVLGTFGCMGIITKASIKVLPCKTMLRSFRYVYDTIDPWLSDYEFLLSKDISNLQGICVKSKQDPKIWNFLLELTIEGNSDEEIKNKIAEIGQLKNKNIIPSSDYSPKEFLNRYAPRFEQMRTQGKMEQHHPFLEFIVASENVRQLIEESLRLLPASYEDGFRLIFINRKNLPPNFVVPKAERICMFAILPTGIQQEDLEFALVAAKSIHDHAISLGAKRYLSGWLGMLTPQDLKTHFGEKFAKLKELKKNNDPKNTFRSLFSEKFFV